MKAGWQTKQFGDVVDIRNGKNQREVESDVGEYPIYGSAGNVMGYATSYICEAGTTIIGRKGNINSPIYADTCFWNVDTAFGLSAKSELNSRFLYYFCLSYDFSLHNRGTTIPSLVKSELLQIHIPLPPLPEQQRIVTILDEAFEGIATAKANAEKNLKNARALFESNLQSVFEQRGEGWDRVRIEDACESIIDCVNKTATKVDEPTPFKMIRTTNVRNGCVNLDSVYYVTEDVYRIWTRRQIPQRGDVILTREAPMGEVGMIMSDDNIFLGQRLVSYRANPSKLNNRFLLYAFQSGDIQSQIHSLASGSTVQHIRVPDSKNLQLPLPSLSVQEEVVATLDIVRAKTQRLESIYKQKLTALDDLKKSLLHQAFSGLL
jgi:type I restriction enzyme S subunit